MKYTKEHLQWLEINGRAKEWENLEAFTKAFNSRFELNQSKSAISTVLYKRGIGFDSKGKRLTAEQLKWIKENLDVIEWKNQQHFTDTFNALFGTNITANQMNQSLHRRKWSVKTRHNTNHWTAHMDKWLADNYTGCECDFVRLANDFNTEFDTDKSASCVRQHLTKTLGIHTPTPKKRQQTASGKVLSGHRNKGTFQKGKPSINGELPVGTIRHNSDGRAFIKVKPCNGEAGHCSGGHNYREPWWKPLQKKIWEDHYGEVPEGYVVCTLSGNPDETDIKNIGIIDKRGTARMAKNEWWSIDNVEIKRTAVQWCNLYCTEQDSRKGMVT